MKVHAKKLQIILAGLGIWWLVVPIERYLMEDGWRIMSWGFPVIAVAIGLIVLCFQLRKYELGVLVWTPLAFFIGWILFSVTPAFFGELGAGGMSGGGAPLGGVAMLLLLFISVASLAAFIFCLISFPRNINWALLGFSLVNCAAIAVVLGVTAEAESREIITIKVLDRDNRPVAGASVRYSVYGYGPGGSRPGTPEISGRPMETNADGFVSIRSKRTRHEVFIEVGKAGYQFILVNLGMQYYDKYPDSRDIKISILRNNEPASMSSNSLPEERAIGMTQGRIPPASPLVITLLLPSMKDGLRSLRFKDISRVHIRGDEHSYRFLDFRTGFFTNNSSSDLRFDFVSNSEIKITALHGGGVLQVPRAINSTSYIPPYEQMMQIAPVMGYTESVILDNSRIPDPWLYFRNADGTRFVRLSVYGYSAAKDNSGNLSVQYWLSLDGSRNLLFDPALAVE